MQSTAKTVEEYITSLPEERQATVRTIRDFVRQHLPAGYEETMLWGMIVYCVPLTTHPDTYNKQPLSYVGLASQKNYLALYLSGVYAEGDNEFRKAYAKSGKKLDMGKSCIRFKKVDDLDLPTIAQAIEKYSVPEFIATYEAARRK